uniref:Dipeptidase n=4 Tax=Lygus hesperus TaxID=30085 RepID=A0A0A9ZHE5_LYGHE
MSFFHDCWDSVRGNVRNCLTTPLTKKRLLIFGGIFVAFVLFIVILVVCLNGGSSSPAAQGSDALNNGPLTFGLVDNSWLKTTYINKINENLAKIEEKLNLKSYIESKLGAMIWSVGASNCAQASQKDAVSQTLEGIDAAKRLASSLGNLILASGTQDMTEAKANSKVAMLISLDGGYTIDSRLGVLRMFRDLGVRVMTLTGNCSTPWASSSSLTTFGKAVVGEANRMGLLLDLAGSSSAVITAALASSTAPVIFNGIGSQSLTNVPTNLDNATLSSLKGKGHVVMVSFKCAVIKASNGSCSQIDVINHINVIRDLAGAASVGIAADFGGADADYPTDLKNISGVADLFNKLYEKNNWGLSDLEGLAYGNFINALQSSANAANSTQTPNDNLEDEAELKILPNNTLVCYSDVPIRYPTNTPTAATTPATTAVTTAAPTTQATTPTTTQPTTTAPETKKP